MVLFGFFFVCFLVWWFGLVGLFCKSRFFYICQPVGEPLVSYSTHLPMKIFLYDNGYCKVFLQA